MTWNRVLTIIEYFDGPELGIAELDGKPYLYKRQFDKELDDYSDIYALSPVDDSLLALTLEDWVIWSRWRAAWDRGEVPIGSHPALPEERERHEKIKLAIGDRLTVVPESARFMRGRFRNACFAGSPAGEVCWSEIDGERATNGS